MGEVSSRKHRRTGIPETRKQRWAARLQNWPLLRLLVVSFWFRLAVLGMLLAAMVVAVMLPKFWQTTPPDFRPEVKISLLDRLQSWSLRRTATISAANGDIRGSFLAWRAAWANNMADLRSIRGLLEVIPRLGDPDQSMGAAATAGGWMYRLGATDPADMELVARAWVTSGLSDRAANLLDSVRTNMPPQLERIYLMSLFQGGRAGEFGKRMEANREVQADLAVALVSGSTEGQVPEAEPFFSLFCLAYYVGWGDDGQRRVATEKLRAARQIRETEALAYNLEFLARERRKDTEACGQILRELQDIGRATIEQSTSYWLLLLGDGRKREAAELATRASLIPRNAIEAYRLAQAYTMLDMWDEAEKLLQRFSESSSWAAEMMVLHGDLLIRARKWDELQALALQLRMQPAATDLLGGYPQFLEGVAEWRRGDREVGRQRMLKAVEIGFKDPSLAFKVADNLVTLGAVDIAEPILLAHRDSLAQSPQYFQLLTKCAAYLKESDYLIEAAEGYYRLRPTDPVAINNYAAALLIFRRAPEEAIRLTVRLHREYPNSKDMILNHAQALAVNGRHEEAEQLLTSLLPDRLAPLDAAQYYITLFEVYSKTGRIDRARKAFKSIDTTQLFPVQIKWLAEAMSRLE